MGSASRRVTAACLSLLALAALAAVASAAPPGPGAAPATRVKVAVLPFAVHSAKPLDHLQRSIPDLLQTRIEAAGRVDAIDPAVVKDAAGRLRDPSDEAALRVLARDLGADYVVTGSLTELAGRYSLDARVTPRSPQSPSESIVLTAGSEDELLGRVNELADRVVSVASGAERALVLDVAIDAPMEVDPAVKGRLRTQAGKPYDAEAAREDVALLETLAGVGAAKVQTEYRAGGVAVRFQVVPAGRLLTPGPKAAAAEGRVAEIRVRGNRRIEADAIRARISTKAGDPYSPERIANDVHAVFGLGFFRNVRVFTEEGPDGRIVTFDVEENPVVRQIAISGNEGLEAEQIRDALTLTTGSTLDYPLLYENTARIEALYRAQGYYLAKVKQTIQPLGPEAVAVTFEIDEGEKLRLEEIVFEGNEALSDSELSSGLQTKPWRFWSYATTYLDKSGTYSEPVFAQDLRTIEQRYTDKGYIQVEIGEPRVDPTKDGLIVTVPITEGAQYRVGAIDLAGDTTADVAEVRETLKLKTGDIFNRSLLTKDVEHLTHEYTDRGYYFATVSPQTKLDPDTRVVDVTYQVERGSLYFIRQIEISGNTTTIDPVLRREMQLVEGQLWSARAIDTSKQRLQNLGFFEEVNFEPKPTDKQGELDLGVKVVERPTGSLSFGAGFSSQDRFIFSGSLSQSNLFGWGYGVQFSADIGGRADRFFLSFSDPYFLDSDWSLGTTLYRTNVEYDDFSEKRTGADVTFGHALNEANTARGFIGYSFALREIEQDSNVRAASLIFRETISGSESTSLMSISVRGDEVDNRLTPTDGFQYGASVDYAGLGGFAQFVRFEARANYYIPMPDWFPLRSSWLLGARTGWAIPFNSVSDYDLGDTGRNECLDFSDRQACALGAIDRDLKLPLSERYFLGGLGTFQLRGYKARTVGPRRAVLYPTGIGPATGMPVTKKFEGSFAPLGVAQSGQCTQLPINQGNGNYVIGPDGQPIVGEGVGCNRLQDKKFEDFGDLDDTDAVGGNKFISLSIEYRFPISEALGLMGIVFFDAGNAFAEDESLFTVGDWRYGTGFGALWFSPFGPLQGFLGFPIDPYKEIEDSIVFEFSVGGANF